MEPVRVVYRGYDINVAREECMANWYQLYFTVFRHADLYMCLSGYAADNMIVDDLIEALKEQIDLEVCKPHPWSEGKQEKRIGQLCVPTTQDRANAMHRKRNVAKPLDRATAVPPASGSDRKSANADNGINQPIPGQRAR